MRNRGLLSKTFCTPFNQLTTLTYSAVGKSYILQSVLSNSIGTTGLLQVVPTGNVIAVSVPETPHIVKQFTTMNYKDKNKDKDKDNDNLS